MARLITMTIMVIMAVGIGISAALGTAIFLFGAYAPNGINGPLLGVSDVEAAICMVVFLFTSFLFMGTTLDKV